MLRRLQVESYALRIVVELGSVNSMAPNLESDWLNLGAGRSIPQTAGDLRHARCIASNTRRGASAPGGRASGSSDGKTALRLSPPHVPAHIPSCQHIEDCDLLRGRRFRSTTKRSPHGENTSSSTAFTPTSEHMQHYVRHTKSTCIHLSNSCDGTGSRARRRTRAMNMESHSLRVRPLGPDDDTTVFDCGHPDLNRWLEEFAWAAQRRRTAATLDPTLKGDDDAPHC